MLTPFWQRGGVTIYVGDALAIVPQLAAQSVQCVVTSPPYMGLRSYKGAPVVRGGDPACAHTWEASAWYMNAGGAGVSSQSKMTGAGPSNAARVKAARWLTDATCTACGAWQGQLGHERTVTQYVDHLAELLDALRTPLRRDGTLWLNLGDSRTGSGPNRQTGLSPGLVGRAARNGDGVDSRGRMWDGVPKSLRLVPAQVALAMMARDWSLRADIVWSKPNALPESVRDRPSSSHEYLYLFTQQKRYVYNWRAIAERTVSDHDSGNGFKRPAQRSRGGRGGGPWKNTRWKNARDVWAMAVRPGPGDHAAVFPPELPRRCILAGSNPGDIILDPFGGAGTTAAVARALGRACILVERSEEYAAGAIERLRQDLLLPSPVEWDDDDGEQALLAFSEEEHHATA